ncbi:MAG: 16S rRNA (guanine(527)-N(7))-methyltransferase RsmG [Acidimicrobiia bacterium]|nr:16S rRNA (guanine(527)-N(7))-methyltransferase RsmG [Acidimicrobiia bacterium]
MSEFRNLLLKRVQGKYEISLEEAARMDAHFELLQRWNRRLNLSRIETVEEAIERHYCESIALARALPSGALRIVDAGSGAGFPGIPMAIVRPECLLYLVESDSRKAVFLREATLGLSNCEVVRERLERVELSVSWVVGRAVRWQEILAVASRLSAKVGLMVTADQSVPVRREATAFRWDDPVPFPWDNSRVLLFGALVA